MERHAAIICSKRSFATSLQKALRIDHVIHIANAGKLEALLAGTGGLLRSQLTASDLVVLRNTGDRATLDLLKRLIHSINPGKSCHMAIHVVAA
ncbi:MAG: hypothetical protein R2912_08615 [Eubacteriales bacterium]